MILPEDFFDRIGPAVNSSRSLFLFGPPGNGKTTVAELVADILGGEVFVPHAIEVDGQQQARGTAALMMPHEFISADAYDFADGAHGAYESLGVTQRRKILFVKPDYFILCDLLSGEGSHTYEQFFHFAGPAQNQSAQVTLDPETLAAVTDHADVANVHVFPAHIDGMTASFVEAQETEEAMAVASRLRRDGMAGPSVLAVLCDLQAEAGMVPEARRTCSELVEFNSDDPGARQRLGDLFLRQAWYADAYRQYKTLVESFEGAPGALLRLAAAAAGMGKVDEALRIERKVASGDGEPGPMDPRRWARLHSAARLAGMILDAKASNDKNTLKALLRNLKRTQVFGSSASIVVLVWEDLHVKMDLVAMREDEVFPVSERISADQVGLQMMDLGRKAPADVKISVKLKGAPLRRAVKFKLFTITWDGKNFTIDRQISQIEPGETTTPSGYPA